MRESATRTASVDIGVHGVLVGHGWVYVTASLSVGKAKAKRGGEGGGKGGQEDMKEEQRQAYRLETGGRKISRGCGEREGTAPRAKKDGWRWELSTLVHSTTSNQSYIHTHIYTYIHTYTNPIPNINEYQTNIKQHHHHHHSHHSLRSPAKGNGCFCMYGCVYNR